MDENVFSSFEHQDDQQAFLQALLNVAENSTTQKAVGAPSVPAAMIRPNSINMNSKFM